ncbi:MAG: beta-propeller fold lactonase family protein [Bryobacteraceae bacterium]
MRLTLLVLAAMAAQTPVRAKVALYAALGPELATYELDAGSASLAKHSAVTLPQNVQEAWPHPSRRYLYVAWSNNVAGSAGHHGVTAFRIDPATGVLAQHGKPITLAARTVHMTVDAAGRHLVVASNQPSGATAHAIAADGTLGAPVPQPAGLDFGIYAHQVRVDPTDKMAIVVTRGNVAAGAKPEEPGAIKVYGYRDGVLRNRASVAPGGGRNYQPRHLDFHPSRPFAFVTLEAQNKLQVYRVTEGPSLGPEPLFTRETLVDPSRLAGQAASAIHVHPNGRFVYLGNRGLSVAGPRGKKAAGENSIAVFAIDQETGEPKRIQNADTHGSHPRTFAIDPSGRILVVANIESVESGPATLSVFRIGGDGKLEFVRKYDQDARGRTLFWTGMVALP